MQQLWTCCCGAFTSVACSGVRATGKAVHDCMCWGLSRNGSCFSMFSKPDLSCSCFSVHFIVAQRLEWYGVFGRSCCVCISAACHTHSLLCYIAKIYQPALRQLSEAWKGRG
jgi:hypothetical protein